MDDLHLVDTDTQLVSDDLGKGGVMPLAVAVRSGHHIDGAGGVDPHGGGFIQTDTRAECASHRRRGDAAGLDIARQADAAIFATCGSFGTAGLEALVVDHLQRLVQRCLIVTDVILQRHRGLVREGILRDEVHPAELGRIHADLACRRIHHPLQQVGGLRPSGTAIGVNWRSGRGHALHIGVDRRNLIAARQQRGMQNGRRHNRECRQVRADIGQAVDPQAGDAVVGVERHSHLVDVVAAMRVGKEGLAAVGRPFDRTLQLLRYPGADCFFRIDINLRSEAAADIGGDNAELGFRNAQHEGTNHKPCQMRVLRGGEQRVGLVDGVIFRYCGTGLHRVWNKTVVPHFQLDHGGGVCQRGLGGGFVAKLEIEIHVVRHILVDLHALGGGSQINNRCQDLVINLDKLGRVTRLLQRFRNHGDNMVTHIADRAIRENRVRWLVGRRSVTVGDDPAADRPADAISSDILARVDGDHTVCLGGGVGLDRLDVCMRMVRADEMHMKLSMTRNVGRVTTGTRQKPFVFLAAYRRADAVLGASLWHCHSPIFCAPA